MDDNPYRASEAVSESPENGQSRLIQPSVPPKSPLLMFALNLLIVGLGQMILGQTWKGIAILVAVAAVAVLTDVPRPLFAPICGVIFGLDAFMIATKLKQGAPVGRWEFF